MDHSGDLPNKVNNKVAQPLELGNFKGLLF